MAEHAGPSTMEATLIREEEPRGATRRLSAIVFTDIAGYTALMQEDETRARVSRDRHRAALERHTQRHGGRMLQHFGDGTLSVFDSAIEAVTSSVSVQRELVAAQVPVRIGIHTGDIVYDEEGVFGDGVNVASRIQNLGTPGSVLLSAKVHDEIKNQPQFESISLGAFQLKNVRQPVEVFAMVGQGIRAPSPETLPSRAAQPSRSVAVLPFMNISADPENEYFSDGITEELINVLTRVDGLQVTARTSTFAFKNKQKDVRQIARLLGVETVLEGSVRKAGQRIRVTAQLIDASNGYHLFSQTYDRLLADMFDLQDEIAVAIVNAVQHRLGPERSQPLVTSRTDARAHELYLRGLHEFRRWTPESFRSAIRFYEEALRIDPNYAWAYAALAEAHGHLAFLGQADFEKAWAAAEAAGLRAIELDPVIGEAHLSLGLLKLFYRWEFDEAYQRIQKALARNPGLARTHHAFGLYLTTIGEPARAVEEFETAVRLDPLSLPYMMSLSFGYLNSGRAQDAIATQDRILSLDPMFPAAYEARGIALLHQGNAAEAMRMFQRVIEITGDPCKCLGPRGSLYAATGQLEEARRMIEMIHERLRMNPELSPQIELASIHTALGEVDKAIEYLDEAARRRLGDVPLLVNSSLWAGLRRHPAFWAFLERHGLRRIARGQPPA